MASKSTEKYKDEKISPFAWVDCLTQKRGDLMEEHGEAAYPAFMVNRAMSQYPDCVHFAAQVNLYRDIPHRYAYDFYMNGIRKGKRFAQWGKKKSAEGSVGVIMSHYEVSREKAEELLRILTDEQVKEITQLEKAKDGDVRSEVGG